MTLQAPVVETLLSVGALSPAVQPGQQGARHPRDQGRGLARPAPPLLAGPRPWVRVRACALRGLEPGGKRH